MKKRRGRGADAAARQADERDKGVAFKNCAPSATDTIKIASKRAIQKTAEVTVDLVCNKIADKITSASKKSLKKPRDEESSSTEVNKEIPKERYISPKGRQQIIDELRLI